MSDHCTSQHNDPAAFPLPIGGLFADLELGIGALSLPDDFFAASGAVQMQIIADWHLSLEQLRRRALLQMCTDEAAAFEGRSQTDKVVALRAPQARVFQFNSRTRGELGARIPAADRPVRPAL